VPKAILALMNVEGMTRENVASHLQKYRIWLKRLAGFPPGARVPPETLQRVRLRCSARRRTAARHTAAVEHAASGGPAAAARAPGPEQRRLCWATQARGLRAA
jgi:hypothetical protein